MNLPDLPHSPAAERNLPPILAGLGTILGPRGSALEIASGTGQHVAGFADAFPGWTWQPTDADTAMLPAIAERIARAGLANVQAPVELDVTSRWPSFPAPFDAIFCANMLHIAPWEACVGLMAGAARHLAAEGRLITYGPYFERGVAPAPSNLAFDESLRARDARWGIRALEAVAAEAARHGLALTRREAMPANNLLLVFARG